MSDVDNSQPVDNTTTVAPPPGGEPLASTPSPVDTTAGLPDPDADGEPKPEQQTRDRKAERRISKLTAKYEEAQREIGRLQGLAEARATPQAGTDGPAKPQESQFANYADYQEALTDWKVDQKLAARDKETSQRQQQQTAEQAEAGRAKEVIDKLVEAGKDLDGFDDVLETITSKGFPISPTMRDYLGESDHPALLAQWLADNKDQALRIARLDPAVAVKALDREEARLGAKPPVRTSRTPPPPPTVNGRSVAQVDLSKVKDMDEYAKLRGFTN